MTTTTLYEYLNEINQLLEADQFEAVVGHSFHILKQYPRHVDTYRVLAKGLLGLNRYEEAKELFQRILSADPHDLIAHIALSDLAQAEDKADVAQYHLERALELDPYNSAIQEELNRYYDVDEFGMVRIQLNNGGLAHLYMRGELYDQATSVLGELIAQNKDRIDLEVLLAEALWREGNRVEAAEVSLKILDSLPNCILANAVLTDIWFSSERVGDARKKAHGLQSMVLVDKKSVDPESVIGAALKASQAPELPDLIQIEALETVSSKDIAVSMQEITPGEKERTDEDVESDPGDMFDWLSGVVKPSAEIRMEEVLEPDSWPAGEGDLESDWFMDDEGEETAVSEPQADASPSLSELAFDDHLARSAPESDPSIDEIEIEDSADELVLKFNEQAEENAAVPEWIATANSETAALPSATESDEFFDSTSDVIVPDWLSQAANEDFEPVQLDPLTASQWLTEGTEEDEEKDDYDNLPEGVKDTKDWLADLNQEFTEIIDEESQPADWLQEESVSDEKDLTIDDWFSDVTDSKINEDTLISENSDPVVSDDWLSDEWDVDPHKETEQTESIESAATEKKHDLAPTMNNEEPANEKETPKPEDKDKKQENVFESDVDDWLAQLTEGSADDDEDWMAEFTPESDAEADAEADAEDLGMSAEQDSVANFLEELQDAPDEALFPENENLDDINQWLEDLSDAEELSPDDWLSNLVDEEADEQKETGFTDWLNRAVVDREDELNQLDSSHEEDRFAPEEVTSTVSEVSSLTDLLGNEGDETFDLDAAPDSDWMSEEAGLTDILSGEGILSEAEDDEGDTEEMFEAPSLTDLLGEEESAAGLGLETSDDDWDNDDSGLTDLLSDAGLGFDADEAEDDEGDAEEMFEAPSLTDLLGEEESAAGLGLETSDDDWDNDDSGLTDLLSDAGLHGDENINESDDALDMLEMAEAPSLTDILSHADTEEEFELEAQSEGDWLSDEGGLTDLLSEGDFDQAEDLDDLDNKLGKLEMPEVPSLTDLLEEDEEDLDLDPSLTDLLSEENVMDTLGGDQDSDDALDLIDTNLPEWLNPGEAQIEPGIDIPDWMTNENDSETGQVHSDDLEEFLANEIVDDEVDDEVDESEPSLATTGLLGKLDEIPTIKASIEEKEQAEKEAAKPFESEMSDFLTSADDTAWLNQLAGSQTNENENAAGLEWMEDVTTNAELDWLDTNSFSEQETIIESELEADDEDEAFDDEPDSVDTPGDLDDAMSWLEDLAAEQKDPIQPLPTVAEILDEDTPDIPLPDENQVGNLQAEVEAESESDLIEDDVISTAEAMSEASEEDIPLDQSDQLLNEAMAEMDDAMAWLDELNDEADILAEENEIPGHEAGFEASDLDDIQPEMSASKMVEERPEEADIYSERDVPDDMDDAMAWLEQLAANQDAPLEELSSLSEDDTVVMEAESPPLSDDTSAVEAETVPTPDPLMKALDWLEEIANLEGLPPEKGLNGSIPKTTAVDLAETLDWLEDIANQPVPSLTKSVSAPPRETSPVEESSSEKMLSDYFDMPDDPDEALAWLNADMEDELEIPDEVEDESTIIAASEAELEIPDEVEEEATVIDLSEDELEIPDEVEQEAPRFDPEETAVDQEGAEAERQTSELSEDDLFAGMFDIPDDPDEAMAWLEEVAEDDAEDVYEKATDDLLENSSMAEPVEEMDVESTPVVDRAIDEAESVAQSDEIEEDFLAMVPEDQDEAMAWLEQLAARQGAPIEELPSVTEASDEIGVPDWIKTDVLQKEADASELLEENSLTEEEDELPEGLPDWFSLDEVGGDEDSIPSQTDWLESVPEFGGTDWLASESEASSIISETIDVLPDTGPLIDPTAGQDLTPDSESVVSEPDEDVEEAVIIDEPDSAVYKVDHDQLQSAKNDIDDGRFEAAIPSLQRMVAQGNGLMMLIGELETIAKDNPEQPAFRRLLGDAYMRNGQLQKALLTYREALDQL